MGCGEKLRGQGSELRARKGAWVMGYGVWGKAQSAGLRARKGVWGKAQSAGLRAQGKAKVH